MSNISNFLSAVNESLLKGKPYQINRLFALMLCVISISSTALAAPADLDPTFGNAGKVVSSPDGSETSRGIAMALQSDGKIVKVGNILPIDAGGMIVARYNADGSLDTTFGNNGWTSVTFGGDDEVIRSVDIQSDGKILIGGQSNLPSSGTDMAIARLNTNGSLDTTFDGDGKVTVGFSASSNGTTVSTSDRLSTLKVTNDGKIVFGGYYPGPNLWYTNTLGRLNADGSLDTTFGTAGKVIRGNASGIMSDLIVQPDGSIYFSSNQSNQTNTRWFVTKLDDSGSEVWLHSGFQKFGIPIGLYGLAIQPDGKIIAAGTREGKFLVIRLTTGGSEDPTFTHPATSPDGRAVSVAIQPDGKVVAIGSISGAPTNAYSIARYNPDGSFDFGFGNLGIIQKSISNGSHVASDVIIQPDDKILVGGGSLVNGNNYFTMTRYQGGNFVPDDTAYDFDGDGKSDIAVFRPSENKWYVLRSTDFGITQQVFAISGDVPVPADYDGDGITDFTIFRNPQGDWWSLSSASGNQIFANLGQNGDFPRPSDFDGDDRADYVIYRPGDFTWYRVSSANGQISNKVFGATGDKPVIGDFDGDGKSDVAIYRPSTGNWWWQSSVDDIQRATRWGISTDIPIPGDYDGDGKTDFAVYRPETGVWYILNSSTGQSTIVGFGISEDKPVPADYDGDGKIDIAVYRPSTGVWYLLQTTAGFSAIQFGLSTDIPVQNALIS